MTRLLVLVAVSVLTAASPVPVRAGAAPLAALDADATAWPLDPRGSIVHGFDPPGAPWDAGHRGVDVSGTPGQLVRASRSGTVSFVGTIAGKPVVVISHGDTRTTYEPVAGTVAVGADAPAGSPVGRLVVEHSHCFPAACLHWGLREGRTYLDPLVGLPGPVRLLPLNGPPLPRSDRDSTAWSPPLSAWTPPAGVWRPTLDAGA